MWSRSAGEYFPCDMNNPANKGKRMAAKSAKSAKKKPAAAPAKAKKPAAKKPAAKKK